MGDEADDRLDRLFVAVRSRDREGETLDEYFETRLMARIAERKRLAQPWYLSAWRMLPGFVLLTLITVACSIAIEPLRNSDLFADIVVGQEDRITISSLAGE